MIGILLGALFTFVFGGALLILLFGGRRIDAELAENIRVVRSPHAMAPFPGFLTPTSRVDPGAGPLDDVLLEVVQRYLEAEQTAAEEFVSQPSLESLYRESGRRLVVGN